MTGFDKFKELWFRFKNWLSSANEEQRSEKKLAWAKARLEIKNSKAYPDFKEWLESMEFDCLSMAMKEGINFEEYIRWSSKVNIVGLILREIDQTNVDQILMQEKNIEILKKRQKTL